MNQDEIKIDESSVVIFGTSIGFMPCQTEFEAVISDKVRMMKPLNGRQRKICDSKGLSWLIDLELNTVLWFQICLGIMSRRPQTEDDCSGFFTGKVRIGKYTIQGSFSTDTAEILRRLKFPKISLLLVPQGKTIRSITISFDENERQSDLRLKT